MQDFRNLKFWKKATPSLSVYRLLPTFRTTSCWSAKPNEGSVSTPTNMPRAAAGIRCRFRAFSSRWHGLGL